jgi:predicted PhzF superfamily epimerase YddE/YHI9
MAVPLTIVDAGEPAAVVLLRAPESEAWLAGVARFLRLPVTAFLSPEAGGFGLRWFGAAGELDFSGGGAVAVAHVVWETEMLAPVEALWLDTASGRFVARRRDGRIEVCAGERLLFTGAARTVVRGELAWPP